MAEIDLTRYVGIPYVIGGSTFQGVDCWGLVWLFYKEEFGIEIPRYSGYANQAEMTEVGNIMYGHEHTFWEPVKKGEEQLGDVVEIMFFRVLHVGLFLPKHRMLHSMGKTASVIEDLTHLQWRNSVRGCYRRV